MRNGKGNSKKIKEEGKRNWMKNGGCAKRKNVKNRNKKGLSSKKEFKSKNSDVCKNRYAGKRRTVGNRYAGTKRCVVKKPLMSKTGSNRINLKSKTRFDRSSLKNKRGSDRINLKSSDDCNKLSSVENLKNNGVSNSSSVCNSSK